jgi:hypothetical protein
MIERGDIVAPTTTGQPLHDLFASENFKLAARVQASENCAGCEQEAI